ncbi:interleukin-34 isoform X2 [Rhincodon typus]|uniref:interleukin-34 isoform X2 n=1 Tax=Rhincodon typus TaxID=259920 RepID=UPI0020302CF6|nr:interleukin-34 isoform X2 [Rhincodon typus]
MTPKMLRHSITAIYFILLGVFAVVSSQCVHLLELHSELQYSLRVRYMKDYFPVNYAVKVHYEDIYRTINVTRMIKDIEDERVEEILYRISDVDEYSKSKSIRPKALFDNCYRVMKQLFHCNWRT